MGASFLAASKATILLSNTEWDAPLIGCSGHPRKIKDFASNFEWRCCRDQRLIRFGLMSSPSEIVRHRLGHPPARLFPPTKSGGIPTADIRRRSRTVLSAPAPAVTLDLRQAASCGHVRTLTHLFPAMAIKYSKRNTVFVLISGCRGRRYMLVVVVQLPDFGEVAHVQNVKPFTFATEPDTQHYSRKGLFGIICKQPPPDARTRTSRRGLRYSPHPTTAGVRTNAQLPETAASVVWSMQRCRMTISTTLAAFATHFWIIPFMKTSFLLVT